MTAPIPSFVARWQPEPEGTLIARPRLFPTSSAPVPKVDPFASVELQDVCGVCGWRFGPNPTRCECIGSTPRTAPPRPPDQHWTERAYR